MFEKKSFTCEIGISRNKERISGERYRSNWVIDSTPIFFARSLKKSFIKKSLSKQLNGGLTVELSCGRWYFSMCTKRPAFQIR
jgi:hypothetical protein